MVIAQLLIGLGVALLLNARSKLLEAIRTTFLMPMVLPPIVVAIIWKVIYTPDISPMHRLLAFVGLPVRSLITHPDTALWAIAVADTWEWFPFTMLIVLASLQMMPGRAARGRQDRRRQQLADPSGTWSCPTSSRRSSWSALFRLIDSVKAFPLIYVLTNGGPGQVTEVTNYFAFVQAFNFSYWGYASAPSPPCWWSASSS